MGEIQFFRGFWTYERRIIPSELGNRLRQFLQPAVIRKAPVVNARIGAEQEFQLVSGTLFGRWQARGNELERNIHWSKGRAGHDAFV